MKEVQTGLGGYQTTVYRSALGDMWKAHNIHGVCVRILGPQECVHHLSAAEAREAAAELIAVAEEVEAAGA